MVRCSLIESGRGEFVASRWEIVYKSEYAFGSVYQQCHHLSTENMFSMPLVYKTGYEAFSLHYLVSAYLISLILCHSLPCIVYLLVLAP